MLLGSFEAAACTTLPILLTRSLLWLEHSGHLFLRVVTSLSFFLAHKTVHILFIAFHTMVVAAEEKRFLDYTVDYEAHLLQRPVLASRKLELFVDTLRT